MDNDAHQTLDGYDEVVAALSEPPKDIGLAAMERPPIDPVWRRRPNLGSRGRV